LTKKKLFPRGVSEHLQNKYILKKHELHGPLKTKKIKNLGVSEQLPKKNCKIDKKHVKYTYKNKNE